MSEIRFFVHGIPAPGGSKQGFAIKKGGVYTGRVAIVDAGGAKTKAWRQDVAAAAFQAMKLADSAPLTGAVELELIFHMPRPKSHFRSDGVTLRPGSPLQHVTRPDCTKLARSTEDAMTGIAYVDDGQIVKQTHEKFFSDQPGAWVVLKEADA
jgi:Holliday junction resolvase RusA-like endonuclease